MISRSFLVAAAMVLGACSEKPQHQTPPDSASAAASPVAAATPVAAGETKALRAALRDHLAKKAIGLNQRELRDETKTLNVAVSAFLDSPDKLKDQELPVLLKQLIDGMQLTSEAWTWHNIKPIDTDGIQPNSTDVYSNRYRANGFA